MKLIEIRVDIENYICQYLSSNRTDFLYYAICDLNFEDRIDAYSLKVRKSIDRAQLVKEALDDKDLIGNLTKVIERSVFESLKKDDEAYWLTEISDILEKWAVRYLKNDGEFVKSMKDLHAKESIIFEKNRVRQHIVTLEQLGYIVTKKK